MGLFSTPLGLAAAIARPLVRALNELAEPVSELVSGPVAGRRRWWSAADRTHLEVRGVHQPGTEVAAQDLEERLLAEPGVRGAEVNAVLGRVVVAHDRDVLGVDTLAEIVAEVERDWGLEERGQAPAGAVHPANPAPQLRDLVAVGIHLVGLSYAAVGRVLPLGRLPAVLPGVASLVDSTPRLRSAVEARLGRPVTDALFAVGGAVSQALAQRPFASLTDLGYRLCLRRENTARLRAWQRWESSTGTRPDTHRCGPLDTRPRPVSLPGGPVERVAGGTAALGLTGFAGMLAALRSPTRATGILHSGIPRAAKLGREAFAAQLAVDLSAAGTLVLEPEALRRLDRVDTVLVDRSVLHTGRRVVDEVVVTDEAADEAEVVRHAYELADARRPGASLRHGDWAVVPVTESIVLPTRARETARERAGHGDAVLTVLHQNRPVGLVCVVVETHPLTGAVLDAARRVGETAVIDRDTDGDRLADMVRIRQGEGRVVAVVSADAREALAQADVGIGLPRRDGSPVWGAHLACPGFEQAWAVLDAVGDARRASRHGAGLSVAGSSLGALLGGFGPVSTAVTRASVPVNFAALLALAVGTWEGAQPARHPVPVPLDRTPWHAMSPGTVLHRLATSLAGLDDAESERRRREQHTGEEPAAIGLVRASADELAGPLTPALAAGAGVSATLGSVTDALMILGVLGLNAVIGGIQRVGATRELHQLIDTTTLRVRLRRAGTARTDRADELVPGDVVELAAGDAVPADCRVLEARGLEVDESSLTGESQLVAKSPAPSAAAAVADRSSMLYRGTAIAAGSAVGVVVATGERTEEGRTARANGEEAPVTGVAARLAALTKVALPVTVGAGAVLMLVDLLRGSGLTQALGRAVGLSVAAVPEGLPFVATVAELASARRLARRGVLVQSPATIEALGRVDILCFDKTGTLTEGRIELREVSDGRSTRPLAELTPELAAVLAVGVRASPWRHVVEVDGPLPHPTDRAVLDGARRVGVTAAHGLTGLDWLDERGFEPSRGYHAVLAGSPDGMLLSVKGTPEVVLARCDRWRTGGRVLPFDKQTRAAVEAQVERLARRGYRVLAVAERPASGRSDLDDPEVRSLELRGLLALADPVRPTAARAVDQLRRAGVSVLMITGDHPSTAKAIAAELGINNTDTSTDTGAGLLTGADLDACTDDELAARLPNVTVFARVSPTQKARIVRRLHRTGHTVAMTGDGANDVPAIRFAHVGIALGANATPAAREAADLIVTDDRIETITEAIVEGRAMWASVRDAVSILLGGNLGEIAFTVAAGALDARAGLNARQLLLVNLLTDVLPAMAVAVRPPPHTTPEQLLAEGPDTSLGRALTRDIYTRAITTAAAALIGWTLARPLSTATQASTTGLAALVAAQLGQTIAVSGRTPPVIAAGAGSLAALAVIVQLPGLSQFFGCQPLLPHQWAIALGSATTAIIIIAELLLRYLKYEQT